MKNAKQLKISSLDNVRSDLKMGIEEIENILVDPIWLVMLTEPLIFELKTKKLKYTNRLNKIEIELLNLQL